ncbi:unnamed protein product [Paramecium sonneborni]|uniref:Uncharacterized protein n=1 Tax=Paramecium sonneborni TaxID=65129 RepID=A0A8S1M787_9CILI|nr:unnamed protein product [Paramecium sonneborni]
MLQQGGDSESDHGFQNYDYIEEDDDYNNSFISIERFPNTENPKLNTQVQVDRYITLMELDSDTKNIPKTFGNNFKKFMDAQLEQYKDYFLKNPPPKELINFLNKKETGKQANYTIQDFRDIFHNQFSNTWFQFYIQNFSFLDLINSNRIEDPEKYIKFIEQYLAGAKDPLNFISSRPIKQSKQEKKVNKITLKLEQVQQPQKDDDYQDQDSIQQFYVKSYVCDQNSQYKYDYD